MASKKRQAEGIALLSMYADEDDDMEEEPDMNDAVQQPADPQNGAGGELEAAISSDQVFNHESMIVEDSIEIVTTATSFFTENSTPKAVGNSATPPLQVPADLSRSRSERLTIVDYGHDEAALSPEAEEGEIEGTGRVMFGADLHMSNGEFSEQTPQRNVQGSTPTTQATPQSSGQHGESQLEAMEYTASDILEVPETVEACLEEPRDVDPLENFLPPPPKVKCSDELQEKIIKFLSLKKTTGRSFNAEVRNRKEYRNPDFLLHAVTYQDIDQIGTCFSKDVFDPHGYDKSDFYDEIEIDMKREMERKEQEKKKSQKIEYISVGTQIGTVPTPKANLPVSGVSSVSGSVPAVVDAAIREGRANKKSKWDKVDGDRRNPLPAGGQDSVSATLLSAANAGTAYSAFAFAQSGPLFHSFNGTAYPKSSEEI